MKKLYFTIFLCSLAIAIEAGATKVAPWSPWPAQPSAVIVGTTAWDVTHQVKVFAHLDDEELAAIRTACTAK